MNKGNLREHIVRLRTVFLMRLAGRLGLEVDEDKMRQLVQRRDDATVLAAIESGQRWSWRRTLRAFQRWFGFE